MPEGSLIIQERDLALLHDLFHCRIMTYAHIVMLHFDGKHEACKKRLQKLKAAGYIRERKRHVTEPAVLFLGQPAFRLLKEKGFLENYPNLSLSALTRRANVSEATEKHELAVMDCRTAITSRLTAPFTMVEFSTWPLLNEFAIRHPQTRAETIIRPDAFIHLREGDEYEYFLYLEIDLSSENLAKLTNKAQCYLHYYQTAGFTERLGVPREDYKDCPFRVCMVVKTEERRNNLAEALLAMNQPILTFVWITTMKEATANPLGNIWVRPADYRKAIANSPHAQFAPKRYGDARNFARDEFVASRIAKHRFQDSPT